LKGVRGKYASRYRAGTNLVLLSPDVAKYFPDEQAVNTALRTLIQSAKLPRRRVPLIRTGEASDPTVKRSPWFPTLNGLGLAYVN